MNLMEYFEKLEVITEESVEKAYEIFGKDEVADFFVKIKNESSNNIDFIKKINSYIMIRNLVNEIKNIESEYYHQIKKSNEEVPSSQNAIDAYFREISYYPLLTFEEEKKYCQDLKAKNEISIIKNCVINNQFIEILDLGKIFLSLSNNEYAALILDSLKSFHYLKESGHHKIINYYLQHYDILVKRIGHYPNQAELKTYFNDIDKYNVLTLDSRELPNYVLLEEIKKYLKYQYAKEIMINCNLRLVVNIAKKYNTNIELSDLINEGNLGLMQAVSRFDGNLGYHFSTYAYYWIRQYISRYIYNCSSSVKFTENFKYNLTCFKKKLYKLEQQHKRRLSLIEISKYLNLPIEKVINYISFSYTTVSLDELAYNDEGEITYNNLIQDKCVDIEEITTHNILKYDVDKMLSKLNSREALVIKLRNGIGVLNERKLSLQEVGEQIGVTRERARQIERMAMEKLKRLSKTTSFSHLGEY